MIVNVDDKKDGVTESKGEKESPDDELVLDFPALKKRIRQFFQPAPFKTGTETGRKVKTTIIHHRRWIIPLICILIAVFLSSYFRLYSLSLPVADRWAENQLHNTYRSQIAAATEQQFPELTPVQKQALVEREFQNLLASQPDTIAEQTEQLANQFRDQFQDENGETYLIEIDTYLWFGMMRNYLTNGQLGDTTNAEGKPVYSLRNGRLGKATGKQLHPLVGAYWHKLARLFDRDITMAKSFFLLPAVLISLAVIPVFFITRKIAGNVGGLFAAVIFAISDNLLNRTPAGFTDTDPYNILFPLLVAWFFLEAYTATERRKQVILLTLAGLVVGLHAMTWTGWWYSFALVAATLLLIPAGKSVFSIITKRTISAWNHAAEWKNHLFLLGTFFLSSAIFTMLLKSPQAFYRIVLRPMYFIRLKELSGGSLWPNVLTTVAEFHTVEVKQLIPLLGGNLLVAVALLGIVLMIIRKNLHEQRHPVYGLFIVLWTISTVYAFTKGIRFAILLVPPFAIAFGSGLGLGHSWLRQRFDKWYFSALIIGIAALLFITPLKDADQTAKNQFPQINDAWVESLTKLKNDSPPNAIITSWWDWGHWFTAIAQRKVTMDGGDQGERIHWVGKTLVTDKEKEAIGILRMLNCGQERAPHILEERLNNNTVAAVDVLNDIVLLDEQGARTYLTTAGFPSEMTERTLQTTHCRDLLPNYFITSEDMIGKAGVWGHFGSWDFHRAQSYQDVHRKEREPSIAYLQQQLNLSVESAEEAYQEIQQSSADQWIAPWPGYFSGILGCTKQEDSTLFCPVQVGEQQFPFIIDLDKKTAAAEAIDGTLITPASLVYPTGDQVIEKEFAGTRVTFSLVLIPVGDEYGIVVAHSLQANGLFTRLFFLRGHGLQCFVPFHEQQQVTGELIQVWKVDWECQQKNIIFNVP